MAALSPAIGAKHAASAAIRRRELHSSHYTGRGDLQPATQPLQRQVPQNIGQAGLVSCYRMCQFALEEFEI